MVLKYIKKILLQIEKKRIIDNSNKVIRGINLFKSMIDNDEFKIPKKYFAGPNNNVNLDWINDKIRYEETAEDHFFSCFFISNFIIHPVYERK